MRRAATLVALAAGVLGCAHTTSGRPAPSPGPTHSSMSISRSTPPSWAASTPRPTDTPSSTASTPSSAPPSTSAPPALQRWYGREWNRLPTRRRIVALTFDAGGDAAGVPSILATLHREQTPATFFLTGNWVQRYPAQAREIAGTAQVGDHSQTHPHFTELSTTQIRAEVLASTRVIQRVCAVDPAPLFRFPFGDRNQRTINTVNGLGYLPIGWTVDTLGWQGSKAGITVPGVVARVLAAAQPGEIVLMHVGANPDDGSTLDAHALPEVIAGLAARGYGFVSLSALLTMAPD